MARRRLQTLAEKPALLPRKTFWRRWRLTSTANFDFAPGLLALTDQRLLARDAGRPLARMAAAGAGPGTARIDDHAGVGTLDLLDGQGRLGALALHAGASNRPRCALQKLFDAAAPAAVSRRRQPELQGAAEPDEVAPSNPKLQTPPSTWALLRLWPLRQALPRAAARRLPADAGLAPPPRWCRPT